MMESTKIESDKPLWREFEHLAVKMVSEAFRLKPGIVYVTHQSKDGGYDGVVTHSPVTEILESWEDLTYVEAKLRSGKKGIGLRDFAATLIIALNDAVQTLVVVTNRQFTPQAFEHACRIFSRTNMRVKLVDGATVSGWVRRNYLILKEIYSYDLLEKFILSDKTLEKFQEYRFDHNSTSRWLVESNKLPKLALRSGWYEDGSLADCDLRIEYETFKQKNTLPPLIGERRRKLVERLIGALSSNDGEGQIVTLTGTGGVGKSVIVAHVLDRLNASDDKSLKVWVGKVDVGQASSSRMLFIDILTALFGIDPRELTEDEEEYWEPDALIARLGGEQTTLPIRKAVVRTLKRDFQEYESSWDLNTEPLLSFLKQVVSRRCQRQSVVIVFQELNRSTTETLDFLYQASRVLAKAGASILLEIRDQGYEQTAYRRGQNGRIAIMSVGDWISIIQRFKSVSNGAAFKIDPLSKGEAIEYIDSLVPGLGAQRANVIVRHVGTIPLHLRLTADWHKSEGILKRPDGGIYLVEDIERFFSEQEITPDSVNTIFERVIGAWWNHSKPIYRYCIAATTLLQGRLPLMAIELLSETDETTNIVESLIDSGLFTLSTDNRMDVEVAHYLIHEQMSIFKNGRTPVYALVAKTLIPHIESLYTNKLAQELRLVDLLEALGPERNEETFKHAYHAAKVLAETRDWTNAAQYFKKACVALGGCSVGYSDSKRQIDELRILAGWLEVEVLRYRIGKEENFRRLCAFLTLLRFPGEMVQKSIEYKDIEIRANILEWRYYYVREEFDKAFEVAKRGWYLALNCDSSVDVEVKGKALANYAITLRVKDRREASLNAFDQAMEATPQSYTVRAERLSNIAAYALRDAPAKALQCYKEILEITQDTAYSFSEIIHAHVDVAMADFLMGDLNAAERDAEHAIRLARFNAVPAEEARGRNILGCSLWAKDRVQEAFQEFEEAAFASERSSSHRFLWRMRTNAAGTALELKDFARAYSLANSAEQAILYGREKNFTIISDDPSHMTSRWYAALIAIGFYYHSMEKVDLKRLYKRVRLPRFRKHVEQFIEGNTPLEVFGHTTHLQGERIMITG